MISRVWLRYDLIHSSEGDGESDSSSLSSEPSVVEDAVSSTSVLPTCAERFIGEAALPFDDLPRFLVGLLRLLGLKDRSASEVVWVLFKTPGESMTHHLVVNAGAEGDSTTDKRRIPGSGDTFQLGNLSFG